MTPTIFGYVVLFTLLIAGAAAAIEWGSQGRIGARHVWTVAISLALVAPAAAITWRTIAVRTAPLVLSPMQLRAPRMLAAKTITAEAAGQATPWRRILESIGATVSGASTALAGVAGWSARAASIAIGIWVGLSATLLMWLAFGVLRWRTARVAWERMTVDGIDVDVSPSTGPAVFGFLSHRIVLPLWATGMEPDHRRLILAHECEHIDAHDPERLALAIGAIVLMPWNIGLWVCAARLRRAIELDCDARVLKRFPGTKAYGYVLLEVAARGRSTGPLAIPMVGLLRLPSELEQRLKAMTRKRTLGYRGAIASGLAALTAVSVAFAAPVPLVQVPENVHAVPAETSSRRPAIASDMDRVLDTVPKAVRKRDTVGARRRDSLQVVARELAVRTAAVHVAQARVESTQVALNKQRFELNIAKGRVRAIEPRPQVNSFQTYFDYQVDRPATMIPSSGAPFYPQTLRAARIGGEVDIEFVVDTAGRVVPGSAKVTKATNNQFENSVLDALPTLRFTPAEVHGIRVKQLVRQPFTFVSIKESAK